MTKRSDAGGDHIDLAELLDVIDAFTQFPRVGTSDEQEGEQEGLGARPGPVRSLQGRFRVNVLGGGTGLLN